MRAPAAGRPPASGEQPEPPGKPPVTTAVAWTGGLAFRATAPGGRAMVMDGNAEAGLSPPETLLSALAACTGVDVVEILQKRRTPPVALDIRMTGARASGVPARFVAVDLEYHMNGAGIERVHAERAVDLAVSKYCTVKDSLATDIVFTWRLVLNGERGTDHDATSR